MKSKHPSLKDPRHLLRFLKNQAGSSPADIAKEERVSVESVKRSITTVDMHRKGNSQVEFDLAIRSLVIDTVPRAKETLAGLLEATALVEVKDHRTGRIRHAKVEDKTTRLEAVRIVKDMAIGLQPKAPAVNVNVEQTNQVANLNSTETNEERMRRLREQLKGFNANPPLVAAVPEYIDAGESDDGEEE